LEKYIVKFKDQDCWLAPWDGDPGRTIVLENAKIFKTEDSATRAIDKANREYGHYREMSLTVVET